MYLTEKQNQVYLFIKNYIKKHKIAPTYEEIKNYFGFKSMGTVHDYVRMLEKKGYIQRTGSNQKRALQVIDFGSRTIAIPLVGTVAAGSPLEVYEIQEYIEVPSEMLANGENVALKVRGNSMIDSGIYDGDVVIVKRQSTAENGQIVVALVDGAVTIKRVYFHRNTIELRASNPEIEPIFVKEGQDFQIYGVLVGLYRRFTP